MKHKVVILMGFLPLLSFAQINPQEILASVRHDAGLIFDAFLTPATKSVMQASQGGWYRTAKPLGAFSFDFAIVGTAGFAPEDEESFIISELDFINDVSGVPNVNPTVLGDGPKSTITVSNPDLGVSYDFEMINGLKNDLPLGATPAAVIQGAMGLPYASEVIVRFTPKITVREISGSSYGLGLKHSLTQYFNSEENDDLPFEVSVFANYYRSKFTYDFQEKSPFEGDNQHIETLSNGFSAQALFSLEYAKFSIFGAAGYVGSSSTVSVLGTYQYDIEIGNLGSFPVTFEDLVTLDYNPSAFRASVGAAVHLCDFHILTEFSVQQYATLSAGLVYTLPN